MPRWCQWLNILVLYSGDISSILMWGSKKSSFLEWVLLRNKSSFNMGMKWIRLGRDDKSHKEVSQQTLKPTVENIKANDNVESFAPIALAA